MGRTCIDLSGMMFELGGIKNAKGHFAAIAQAIVNQLPDNVMTTSQALHLVKLTDDGAIFIQQNADLNDMKDCMIRALKITNDDAKLYTVRIYFPQKIPGYLANKAVIDCRRFASSWLYHFLSPIDACDYGNINYQPLLPLSETLHEHYTLIESGNYTIHSDADFVGQSITSLMKKTGNAVNSIYDLMTADPDPNDLATKALKIAQVFRLKEKKYDPYHDTEAFINRGMIEKVESLHKLRTFAWVLGAMAEDKGRSVTDTSWFFASDFYSYVSHKGKKDRIVLNYNEIKYFTALCNQYDWHVFYVPDTYLNGTEKEKYDLRELCGKENRGGNTSSFMLTGIGTNNWDKMQQSNAIISRNEETLASIDALRKDLFELLPAMEKLHDFFLERRIRSKPLTGFLAEVLAAWCALCVAAKEPFYSEEAADTPEADAALEGPMARPESPLNTKYIGKSGEPTNHLREVRLDLHGSSVVKESEFMYFSEGEILVLPEGLREIQLRGFANGSFLEVRFPASLRTIGPNAFMDCSNMEEVIIPEGVTYIDFGAFSRRNELTDIYLPDSLRKLNAGAFYEAEGKNREYISHITVHLSGKCAARLQIEEGLNGWIKQTLAKSFIIDGKAYAKIEDYKAELEKADRERREKQRQEEEKIRKEKEEAEKEKQRESLRKKIAMFENEKENMKGIFNILKKKKIQNQIDELLDNLRRI